MKKSKTLDEQITHLEVNKKIEFDNKQEAKEMLYRYNYINVITPFKKHFAKKGCKPHQYEQTSNINEWILHYKSERKNYLPILGYILNQEIQFNAILSYNVITHYKIETPEKFTEFIKIIRSNIDESKKIYKFKNETIDKFEKSFKENNNNIFVTLDKITFGMLKVIYSLLSSEVQKQIFNDLKKYDLVYHTNTPNEFEAILEYVIGIRNTISHNNSINIYIKYFNKKKWIRQEKHQMKIVGLIQLIESKQ